MTQIKSLVDAIDSFIKGTKADGDWDAIKASCIMAGWDGLAGCLTPLKGTAPTNVGPFVSGDYNRITGLKGGGTKELNSNRNNNADPRNDNHISMFITETSGKDDARGHMGAGTGDVGAKNFGHGSNDTSGVFFRNNSADAISFTDDRSVLNLWGVSRAAAGGYSYRYKGATATRSQASETPFDGNIHVFSRGTGSTYSDARAGFYSIGESLNLANLDTRVTALMTAIGEALA